MSRKNIIEASNAMANLCVFDGVVGLLESGALCGCSKAADQIIRICKKEMQRQLAIHDAAVDRALLSASKGEKS